MIHQMAAIQQNILALTKKQWNNSTQRTSSLVYKMSNKIHRAIFTREDKINISEFPIFSVDSYTCATG